MKAASFFFSFALLLIFPAALAIGDSLPASNGRADLPETNDALQSAWILREKSQQGEAVDPTTSLQDHFAAVLGLLQAREATSLEIAVNRSQNLMGSIKTEKEREARRSFLKKQRRENLEVLANYAEKGRFPQNDYSAEPIPVFVDRAGTACAVGHLMRVSGAAESVAQIAATNRFVYVPDASEGPLIHWILASGLTREEASLIQPAYRSPQLVISEFHSQPSAPTPAERAAGFTNANDFEFIEFYNPGTDPLELEAIRLVDGVDFDFRNSQEKQLNSREYLVLAANPEAFAFRYGSKKLAGAYNGRLKNVGETIKAIEGSKTLFEFTYRDSLPWPNKAPGSSLQNLNREADQETMGKPYFWYAAPPTPGEASSGPQVKAARDLTLEKEGSEWFLSFLAEPGFEYAIEVSEDLSGDWRKERAIETPTKRERIRFVITPNNPRKTFYRVATR